MYSENELSKFVFECGLKIHRKIGRGLYERIYETCLAYELEKLGLKVERQKYLSFSYELQSSLLQNRRSPNSSIEVTMDLHALCLVVMNDEAALFKCSFNVLNNSEVLLRSTLLKTQRCKDSQRQKSQSFSIKND